MSDLSDSFDELLDAQEEATGERKKIKLDGKAYDFLDMTTNLDSLPIGGGDAESGTIEGMVRVSDFPKNKELKGAEAIYDDKALSVIATKKINATFHLTIGDFAADDS